MATVVPLSTTLIDSRDGNHFTAVTTDVFVSDSAVSVSELPDDITASAGIAKETSTSAGITLRNQTSGATGLGFTMAAGDGVKQVTIHADVASGTYIVVVRHVGNAAGTASTGDANL